MIRQPRRTNGDGLHELARAALHLPCLQQLDYNTNPLLEDMQHPPRGRVIQYAEERRLVDEQAAEQIGPLRGKMQDDRAAEGVAEDVSGS
jgi:hypothetical protein